MADCVFCGIASGDIPSDQVYSSDRVVAFRDIAPKAPTHVQVIPKRHYANAAELVTADPQLAAEVLAAAATVADIEGLSAGHRMIFNTGPDGGQEVGHVHLHVLGGRPLGPMVAR